MNPGARTTDELAFIGIRELVLEAQRAITILAAIQKRAAEFVKARDDIPNYPRNQQLERLFISELSHGQWPRVNP